MGVLLEVVREVRLTVLVGLYWIFIVRDGGLVYGIGCLKLG